MAGAGGNHAGPAREGKVAGKLAGGLPWPLSGFDLSGRVALVTGARREIGRAVATALGALGATVAVHHAGGAEEAEDAAATVARIEGEGGRASAFAADFLQAGAGAGLAAQVQDALGAVDILVLNASIEYLEPLEAITPEHFERQIAVNLRATLELLQATVPGMAGRGWGRVVTIGSVQQERPHPRMLVYAGTKAAQLNWARNLARQYGGQGVTVNNLAPGAIATARNQEQMRTERAAIEAMIPVGRLGTPDDLVGAAILLCSDAGRYINGLDLFVDGGRHVG